MKQLVHRLYQCFPADFTSYSGLLSIPVINGTRWLNLGGSVDRFELVVGQPPRTSSDLGLEEAIERAAEAHKAAVH